MSFRRSELKRFKSTEPLRKDYILDKGRITSKSSLWENRLMTNGILILLSMMTLMSCSSTPIKLDRKPSNDRSQVDYQFINNSVGKGFQYIRPKTADGEPNCVAASLRAGGYSPAFALSGTDSFYENILPVCFSERSKDEIPQEGDLGIIYETSVPTLAHMVLFLDEDKVFEKPGPQNDQLFQMNSWSGLLQKEARSTASFQIWKYDPKINCPIENLRKTFNENPKYQEFKQIGIIIDSKIYNEDWNGPPKFNRKRLNFLLKQKEAEMNSYILKQGKSFNFKKSYPVLYENLFLTDLLKTLIGTSVQ